MQLMPQYAARSPFKMIWLSVTVMCVCVCVWASALIDARWRNRVHTCLAQVPPVVHPHNNGVRPGSSRRYQIAFVENLILTRRPALVAQTGHNFAALTINWIKLIYNLKFEYIPTDSKGRIFIIYYCTTVICTTGFEIYALFSR